MDADVWRQAKVLLAEALVCPPGEREAFVNAHCPDLDLRREVQAYLNEYDEHFLESVLTVSDTLDSTSSPASEGEHLPNIHDGDHIGPYVVLGRLGVGGMGMVFLGNDTRLQRKVALKCLSAAASAAELRSRILHEARAAARITHPNIAIVHDVIEHDNRPFLVMEHVEGESLAALIKRERPSIETIVAFLRQLASALAAAHGKGIVHRDLKPANIQVTPEGSVKILDFGVAHAMSAAVSGAAAPMGGAATTVSTATATRQGDRRMMHPGTPAYMSPEQMFGRAIDQRSDIYSLGVIVYEMATGHRPYSTDDPLEIVLTLSKNFLNGDAQASLPAKLSDVIGKMLAVNLEDRYQTAGELENALVPLTAPALPAVAAPLESSLRKVARVALGAVVVPVALTGMGFATTAWFNFALDRKPPFSDESAIVWLQMGTRSLSGPTVFLLGLLLAFSGLRFAVRLLTLSRNVESLLTASRTRTRELSSKLSLEDPAIAAQAVAGLGLVALAGVLWWFWPFVYAASAHMSTYPQLEQRVLSQLRPYHLGNAGLFRVSIEAIALVFAVFGSRIMRLRSRQTIRQGAGALAVVAALFVTSALIAELPYRLVWHNQFERVTIGAERCYAIGSSPTELLAFCPGAAPPRNRIVARTDRSIQRSGVVESIFTPPETSR